MTEGEVEYDNDNVFHDDYELQPLMPRHDSLAHQLQQAESPAWTQTQFATDIVGNKVNDFYESTGLEPSAIIYDSFHLDDDHLYYVEGNLKIQLTHKYDSSKFVIQFSIIK